MLILVSLVLAPAAAQDGEVATVRVDEVRRVPLEQTAPVLGRLVASQAGEVAARVAGPLEVFVVEVGDRVARGEALALLDDATLTARRELAAGALAETRAELGVRRAELGLARQELKRLEGLKGSAAFSQARYDDQRQQVAIAEARVRSARAAIATAQAELRLARIDLDNAEIRAPYPGVVTQRMLEAGAYVSEGDAVVRMLADAALEVQADVPFARLAGVEPGTVVDIALEDGTEHEARVRAVLPRENPLTRTRTVRLVPRFGKTERPLAAGQSVTVHVPAGPAETVLTVHKDAVIPRETQDVVFVVEDGVARVRPVRLGQAVADRLRVVEGLEAGDLTVVRGNERLRPGDKVRIADGPNGAASEAGATDAGNAPG